MKIAIQAADLDHARIDGTRVYIKEVLARLWKYGVQDSFGLYHRHAWNPHLAPPKVQQYCEYKVSAPLYWTQTRFALELWRSRPDVVWMPMQALPFTMPPKAQSVVTIHDLAFKLFPEYFSYRDRKKLTVFTDFAIKNAHRIIAVSHATKRDILRMYPSIRDEKIAVVHHGFDSEIFMREISQIERKKIRERYSLGRDPYILHVGTLQPRKNLIRLVEAFEICAKKDARLKLVLVGEKGWLWKPLMQRIEQSHYGDRIVCTGSVSFEELSIFYKEAQAFVFPSLYEGFGIPILEAFAAGVPVIAGRHSSVQEVAGDAAIYTDITSAGDMAQKIIMLQKDKSLCSDLVRRGHMRLTHFSWDKCAQETYRVLQEVAG